MKLDSVVFSIANLAERTRVQCLSGHAGTGTRSRLSEKFALKQATVHLVHLGPRIVSPFIFGPIVLTRTAGSAVALCWGVQRALAGPLSSQKDSSGDCPSATTGTAIYSVTGNRRDFTSKPYPFA